jgi:protein-tyrosine phosphatase
MIHTDFYHFPPSRITPLIWLGSYQNGADLALANPLDIRAVLNISTEEPYAKRAGIEYKEIPVEDGCAFPDAEFRACMDFMTEQHKKGAKTLVHCAAGISRSANIAAAFLYVSGQMPLELAVQHVKKCRPIVMPHPKTYNSIKKLLGVWPYGLGGLG